MGIDQVRVRASVSIGSSMTVVTPYILSFAVNKARGQIGNFSAKLKVTGASISSVALNSCVSIKAGEGSPSNTIFGGLLKKVSISPCWDDPMYVVMDISGEDYISLLQGKKYTRRVTADTSSWVSIDGVARKGIRGGKFKAKCVGKMDIVHADILDEGAVTGTSPLADVKNIPIASPGEPKADSGTAGAAKAGTED